MWKSSVRMSRTNTWAKSWQYLHFSWVPPSEQANSQVPWGHGPTSQNLLASCIWKIVVNEESIGQTYHFIDIAKGLLCLNWSFAALDVHKLIVRQVECNDAHFLFGTPLVLFLHFWKVKPPRIRPRCPKVHGNQPQLQCHYIKIEVLSIELVNDYNIVTFKWCHHTLRDWENI